MTELNGQGIAAVLFDKDGTLMDFQGSWGPWAATVITRFCEGEPDLMRSVCAALAFDMATQRFHPESAVIAGTPQDVVDLLQPHFPQATPEQITGWLDPDPAEFRPVPVTGVRKACEWLVAQGIKLAVVTNDFESGGIDHLRQMGLTDLFETVIGYDSGFGGKPDPAPCLGAAERLGVPAARCLMVGDSSHDLVAGRRAGMGTVAVLTGVAEAAELQADAEIVLDSVAGLPDWIARRS